MTTIVVDKREGVMVADNQNTLNTIVAPCQKIWRMEDGPNEGTLVGTTGAGGPCLVFMEWFRLHKGHNFEECFDDNQLMQIDDHEDFWCLLLHPTGGIQLVDRFFVPERIPVPYHAVGSGGNIALGAMDAGASAEEALRIACRRDIYTSLCGRLMQKVEL